MITNVVVDFVCDERWYPEEEEIKSRPHSVKLPGDVESCAGLAGKLPIVDQNYGTQLIRFILKFVKYPPPSLGL